MDERPDRWTGAPGYEMVDRQVDESRRISDLEIRLVRRISDLELQIVRVKHDAEMGLQRHLDDHRMRSLRWWLAGALVLQAAAMALWAWATK